MKQKNKFILLFLLVFIVSCTPKVRDTSKRVSNAGVDFLMSLDKEFIADEPIYIPVTVINYRDVPINVNFKIKSSDKDEYNNIEGGTSVTIEGKDYDLEEEIRRGAPQQEKLFLEVEKPRNIYEEVFGPYRYYKDKITGNKRKLNVEARLSYEDFVNAKLSICLKHPGERRIISSEECQYQQLGTFRGEQKISYGGNKLGNARYAAIAISKVDVVLTQLDRSTIKTRFRVFFKNQGGGRLDLKSEGNIYGFDMRSTVGSLSELVCSPDTSEISLKDAIERGIRCSGMLTLDQGYVTEHLIISYNYGYVVTKNAVAEVIK